MIKKIMNDELLPHKLGLFIGGLLGFLLGLMVTDKAGNYDELEYIDEEVIDNGEA